MKFNDRTYRGQVRILRTCAKEALKTFGRDASLKFIFHGENTTFRADRGADRHLVRIHRPGYQTAETICSELMWLEALRDSEITAPEPERTVHGDFLATIDVPGGNPRHVALLKWVEGTLIGARVSEDRLKAMGRLLARLHDHADSFEPPANFVRKRLDADGLFGPDPVMGGGMHLVPGEDQMLFEEVQGRLKELLSRLGEGKEVFGLIHADLHYGNLVFPPSHGARPEAAPIDFDDTAFGYLAYDLAVVLSPLDRKFPGMGTRQAVLDGYREVRPLPLEVEEVIDDFVVARMLTITFWVLSRTDNPLFVKRIPHQLELARQLFLRYSAAA